jgi:Domain of unknown function (DUF4375)
MPFRVPRWAIAGLPADNLPEAVLGPLLELPAPAESDPRWPDATPGQRAIYALHELDSEVCCGGFHQYLANTTSRLAGEAAQGARHLGTHAYAELLTEVSATVFGTAAIPRDRRARQQALDALTDQQRRRLDTLTDRYDALLDEQPLQAAFEGYIAQHPAEFFVEEADEDPVAAASGRLDLAYRLVSRNQPGDLERARPLLHDAQARARALGLDKVEGRCRSLLAQLDGLRLS